jgi:hypothetical protein
MVRITLYQNIGVTANQCYFVQDGKNDAIPLNECNEANMTNRTFVHGAN